MHQVNHIHGDYHWQSQFDKLGGEIQIPFNAGAVHNVEDDVGSFIYQVSTGHHLFQGVGRQGVDARQVLNGDIPAALETALLFLNGDAGPVAHGLAGASQVVEQRGFAAVWVARQGDFYVQFECSSLQRLDTTNLCAKNERLGRVLK